MCMYFAKYKFTFLCFLDRPNKTAQVAGSVPKDYQKSEPPGKLHFLGIMLVCLLFI